MVTLTRKNEVIEVIDPKYYIMAGWKVVKKVKKEKKRATNTKKKTAS